MLAERETALSIAETNIKVEAEAERVRLLQETENECERILAAARANAENQLAERLADLIVGEQNLEQLERIARRREKEAAALAESCRSLLGKIPTVRHLWAGGPANTPRRDMPAS